MKNLIEQVSVDRLFIKDVFLSLTDAQVLGQIGTPINNQYIPSNANNTPFILNTGAPASADGIVINVRYCYTLETPIFARLYQATAGFYRSTQRNQYNLIYDFNITKSASNTIGEIKDSFQCDDLSLPNIALQQGDVLGVCSSKFSEMSIGRVNLIGEGGGVGAGGDPLLSTTGVCTSVGNVPMEIRTQLQQLTSGVLLIYANITDPCK